MAKKTRNILLLPGDGIGPEVISEVKKILEWMNKNKSLDFVLSQNITDEICRFNITGSGDPFGSKMYREFLFDFDGTKHPNIKIDLQTNGVMFTPATWKRIHKVHDNLSLVMVSVDAATEPTYDIVRRDGNWGILLENIAFLSKKRKENKMDQLRLDYVVQWHNTEKWYSL